MSKTALALVQSITAVEFFKPGASNDILEKVEREARALAASFDVSTPAGEAGLRTLAATLAKVKVKIAKEGKALVADEKARLKIIDTERGIVEDRMETLQKEVRQPLTDKEDAEKQRIADHEGALDILVQSGEYIERNWQAMSIEDMRARLAAITNSQRDWQEFLGRARQACATTIVQIKTAIAQREKLDADAAELETLRAAAALQAQKDREENIAREAREAAEASARERAAEQARVAEAERQRVELERAEAEAKAKQAEAQRVAAEAKAVQDAADAAEALRVEQERAQEAAKQAEAERERERQAAAEESERNYRIQHAAATVRYNEAHGRIQREESHVAELDAKLLSAGVLTARKKTAAQLKKAKELDADILRLSAESSAKKTAIATMEKLAAQPQCPTCSQPITAEVMATLVGPLMTAYSDAAQSLRAAQETRKALGDPEGAAREVETHVQTSRDMEAAKLRIQDDLRIQRDAERQLETMTAARKA